MGYQLRGTGSICCKSRLRSSPKCTLYLHYPIWTDLAPALAMQLAIYAAPLAPVEQKIRQKLEKTAPLKIPQLKSNLLPETGKMPSMESRECCRTYERCARATIVNAPSGNLSMEARGLAIAPQPHIT